MSVQQILRETLDNFEQSRQNDETLAGLLTMWKKEKSMMTKKHPLVRNGPTNLICLQQAANVLITRH